MKKIIIDFAIILLIVTIHSSYANKKVAHFISIPLIEGTGIYTSVKSLRDAELNSTKAAAVTNLVLLGTQATLGSLMAAGLYDKKPKLRTFHKIIAYTINLAGIWMSVSTSLDKGTKGTAAQYTSYGYNACVLFPVILFSF